MYKINEKLRKHLLTEHWTATDSRGQQDGYNLACMEERLEECLKETGNRSSKREQETTIITLEEES